MWYLGTQTVKGIHLYNNTDGAVALSFNETGLGATFAGAVDIKGGTVATGSASTPAGQFVTAVSGSTVLEVKGTQGTLFSVVDDLSGLLSAVNDVSGMPVWEVYDDDRVVTYGTYQNSLKSEPGSPSSGSSYTFLYTTGVSPTKEIGVKIKLENGTEYILASTLV